MVRLSAAAAVVYLSMATQSGTGWDRHSKASPDGSPAADLVRIAALQDAVANAWQNMPLTQRKIAFVTADPTSYGSYDERPSNVFKLGEKIITYVEPIGFTWVKNSDSTFSYGLSADMFIKTFDGKILGGQEKVVDLVKNSHVRNQELMLVLSLSLNDADPGDYVIEYTLHDAQSNKTSKFSKNLTLQR
jgi:hypothetical protein